MFTFGNFANANYNGMVASITKRTGDLRGIGSVFFTASYTWAHNLDDADGFARNSEMVSYYGKRLSYASADSDIRNRFVLSGGWDLPFAKLWPSGPKRLTGGWSLYPIVSAQSGLPVNVNAGLVQDYVTPGPSGDGDQGLVRPDWSGGSGATLDPHQVQTFTVNGTPITGHFFFNPSGLTIPACYSSSAPPGTPGGCPAPTYGTLGRNAFRGPDRVNFRSRARETHEPARRTSTLGFPRGILQCPEPHRMAVAALHHPDLVAAAGPGHIYLRSANRATRAKACLLRNSRKTECGAGKFWRCAPHPLRY
jgi:hypothetical protein